MRNTLLILLVVIVCLVFAGRVLGPSDLHDKSQPKTIAYTADIVLHGRWILPRDMVGGPARKPPLYNWIGAPFVALLGYHEWVLKIPAMMAAVTAVAVSVLMARRLLASPALQLEAALVRDTAYVAGIICIANYPMIKLGYLARPDMPLVACLVGGWALATVALTSPATRWPVVIGFWSCVAGAGLSKGPPMVLPILYAIAAAKPVGGSWRSLKRLRFDIGLPLALACVGGWAWGAYQRDPAHFRNVLIGEEILGRFSQGEPLDPYRDPKAMWLVPAWFVTKYAPWSLFVAAAVLSIHPRRWLNHPLTPAMLWVALLIVFFSIPEGKRIDYLAPTYPVASILAAYGLVIVLRRYGVTPLRVAVAAMLLVVVFIDYQWRRSPGAVAREGEKIKSFAREVRRVAGEERIVFTELGFHPLQTLLGRHDTDPPTYGELAGPGWAIAPVADLPGVTPTAISDELPQVKVLKNVDTLVDMRRSGRLGLYRLPLLPGPATTATAPAAPATPSAGHR